MVGSFGNAYSIKHPVKLNRKIKILLYGSNIWSLGEGMMGPIFAIFNEKIGGSILDVSWIWASYLIATGMFTIFVGNISDAKISKEKLMIAGYALNTFFTFSYLLVSSSIDLFFVQIGLGLATALATPTWDALYAQYQNRENAGYIWGLAGGREQLITGVALIIGGLIVNYFSFQLLFITMGIVQAIATIYQAQILRK
jgi:predicted MFS family arabinose efflux permease